MKVTVYGPNILDLVKCMGIHIHICMQLLKKETMNWKERGIHEGGVEGGKGKKKTCNYIIMSKI